MDILFQPIKTVMPNGLTVITMRTNCEGLIAGHIEVGVGAAHAVKINPRWLGLPHFMEHNEAYGASRNHAENEVKRLFKRKFNIPHNANTSRLGTRHFCSSQYAGYVFPSHIFWSQFEAVVDGIYFPKFDPNSLERERARVLEEMSGLNTRINADDNKMRQKLFGVDYLGMDVIGTSEQVQSYTQQDCFELHSRAYTLCNTTAVFTGDVNHFDCLDKLESILRDVPAGQKNLPILERPKVQFGESRIHLDGKNEGYTETHLLFRAVNAASDDYYSMDLAIDALSGIVEDKIKGRYGLYHAGFSYDSASIAGSVTLSLVTSRQEIASEVLQTALEILQSKESLVQIVDMHDDLIGANTYIIRIQQPSIQERAVWLTDDHSIGRPLLSPTKKIARYAATTPEQVRQAVESLSATPIFLNLRGHKDALNALPLIDVIDAWRSKPNDVRVQESMAALQATRAGTHIVK